MSYNIEQINSGYQAFNSGALAAGTNAGTVQNTAIINYANNGIFYQKAATNNMAPTPAGTGPGYAAAAIPPNSVSIMAFWLDSAGALVVSQGPVVGAGGVAPLPPFVNNRTLIGLAKVVTNASTTFTPGTTAFGAAGVTTTFYNTSVMPGTPL